MRGVPRRRGTSDPACADGAVRGAGARGGGRRPERAWPLAFASFRRLERQRQRCLGIHRHLINRLQGLSSGQRKGLSEKGSAQGSSGALCVCPGGGTPGTQQGRRVPAGRRGYSRGGCALRRRDAGTRRLCRFRASPAAPMRGGARCPSYSRDCPPPPHHHHQQQHPHPHPHAHAMTRAGVRAAAGGGVAGGGGGRDVELYGS